MAISDNIKKLRIERGFTQAELARRIGVTRAALTQWETGWTQPRMGMIVKMAEELDVAIAEIVDDTKPLAPAPYIKVPFYGRIAAGTPIEMIEDDGETPIPDEVAERYPECFTLEVRGESMNRILPNGCRAVIDPCDTVERPGQPYAVCINGYDATIKRVKILNNGYELIPDSTDPTFKPEVFDFSDPSTPEITIIGRVVYHVMPFDWEY